MKKKIRFEVPGVRPELLQPVGIEFTKDGKYVFAALGPGNRVAVIDPKTYEVKQYILVGQRPWHLELSSDQSKLYVANGLTNDMTVIDVASLKAEKSVPVGRLPWGVAVSQIRRPASCGLSKKGPEPHTRSRPSLIGIPCRRLLHVRNGCFVSLHETRRAGRIELVSVDFSVLVRIDHGEVEHDWDVGAACDCIASRRGHLPRACALFLGDDDIRRKRNASDKARACKHHQISRGRKFHPRASLVFQVLRGNWKVFRHVKENGGKRI
ncbi:MAG: hypothetical protein ACXVAR_19230 [Vulcanimicrobiaceae bacterium]